MDNIKQDSNRCGVQDVRHAQGDPQKLEEAGITFYEGFLAEAPESIEQGSKGGGYIIGLMDRQAARGMIAQEIIKNMPKAIIHSTAATATPERAEIGHAVLRLVTTPPPIDTDKIETAVRMILEAIGEDTERSGLLDTPARVARFYKEFFAYEPGRVDTTFAEEHVSDQMVTVSDVRVWSMCEHHMLPFYTDLSMGYIADGKVLGLSKFARIAQTIAHGLQTQENIAEQIADMITEVTDSLDVAVLCENGTHTCMTMRGIKTSGSMNNAVMRGVFLNDASARAEFYNLIQRSRR